MTKYALPADTPAELLPENLPEDITIRWRKGADGTNRPSLLYRLKQQFSVTRKGFVFKFTPQGLAEANARRVACVTVLQKARKDAEIRGSPLYAITVKEAGGEYLATPHARALASFKDQLRIITTDIVKPIGSMLARTVTHRELQLCLDRAAQRGLSEASVRQVKAMIGGLWKFLYDRDQVDGIEFLRKLRIPRNCKVDARPREILTDDEFVQFVTCEVVDLRLRCMAVMSRFVGGMRTSDLHAWMWSHIHFDAKTAWVPRPKTKRSAKGPPPKPHELHDVALHYLRLWWLACGRPSGDVPVFGLARDSRKGTSRKGERVTYRAVSYAKRLRSALKRAGIARPELFESNAATLPVDFHSFRRAYATGLAEAQVDGRLAMRLAGHRNLATHERYVMRAGTMSVPDAAVPAVPLTTRTP